MTPNERAANIQMILDDPWGEPIASDVKQLLIAFVNAEIASARDEVANNAVKALRATENDSYRRAAGICANMADFDCGCADEYGTNPDHDKVTLAKAMLRAAERSILDFVNEGKP